jgi:hypothetical protein
VKWGALVETAATRGAPARRTLGQIMAEQRRAEMERQRAEGAAEEHRDAIRAGLPGSLPLTEDLGKKKRALFRRATAAGFGSVGFALPGAAGQLRCSRVCVTYRRR